MEQAITQRDETEADNARLTDALKRTEADLRALQKTHDSLEAKHRTLDTQLVAEQTKADGLNKLVAELKRTNGQLTSDVKKTSVQPCDLASW